MEAFFDRETIATLLGTVVLFIAVSLGLQSVKRVWNWEPRYTWAIVMLCVALVGFMVRLRIGLGVPFAAPRAVADWVWWQVFAHFCASAVPVVAWQEFIDRTTRARVAREVAAHAE
jgi:hypothetical protein